MSKTSQRGLTLVECCTALSICSILAAASIQSFKDMGDRRRLDGRVAELAVDLQNLRTEAIRHQQPVRIRFQADSGGTCYVVHRSADGDCGCNSDGATQCDPSVEPLRVVAFPNREHISMVSNVSAMVFDHRLGTATPGGTVRLSDTNGREVRHIVNIMGRARTCSPDGRVSGHPSC